MADEPLSMPADERFDQTIQDAAAYFGVHVRTIQKWANDGLLHGMRTPATRSRWRFRRSDLRALAEANSNRPKEASA